MKLTKLICLNCAEDIVLGQMVKFVIEDDVIRGVIHTGFRCRKEPRFPF